MADVMRRVKPLVPPHARGGLHAWKAGRPWGMSTPMENSHLDSLLLFLQTRGVDIGLKILGAFAIWTLGRWVIRGAIGVVVSTLERRKTEPTLVRYAQSTLSIVLSLALLIAVLGFCGVETTSFAALIAAAGVAIGMAWS